MKKSLVVIGLCSTFSAQALEVLRMDRDDRTYNIYLGYFSQETEMQQKFDWGNSYESDLNISTQYVGGSMLLNEHLKVAYQYSDTKIDREHLDSFKQDRNYLAGYYFLDHNGKTTSTFSLSTNFSTENQYRDSLFFNYSYGMSLNELDIEFLGGFGGISDNDTYESYTQINTNASVALRKYTQFKPYASVGYNQLSTLKYKDYDTQERNREVYNLKIGAAFNVHQNTQATISYAHFTYNADIPYYDFPAIEVENTSNTLDVSINMHF